VSALSTWLRAHPGPRTLLLVLALTGTVALGLRLLMPSPASSPAARTGGLAASPTPPPGAVSAARLTTPATLEAASLVQAEGVAEAFLETYGALGPRDNPAELRARLRPYDTDRLDASLGQGGAAGASATQATGFRVQHLSSVGLAPEGRLVMVALVAQIAPSGQGGGTRYVELLLALEAGGWRVDEVSP
jgi:hypothetical protein